MLTISPARHRGSGGGSVRGGADTWLSIGGRRVRIVVAACAAAGVVCATVAGCTASHSAGGAFSEPSPSTSRSTPRSPQDCPPHGEGTCLGELTAAQTYVSSSFRPRVTFTVPTRGWVNAEDYPGTFSLLAPSGRIAGINEQTADFIGIATSIAPSQLQEPRGCVFDPIPGRWSTPARVARYFANDAALRTSRPRPVSVGGLEGLMLDVRTRTDVQLTSCSIGNQRFSFAGSFSGVGPTQLDHVVVPHETLRLYLLRHDGGVLLVEIDDVDAAGGGIVTMLPVVASLEFDR